MWLVDHQVFPKDFLSFSPLILLPETLHVVDKISTDERAVSRYKLVGPGGPEGGPGPEIFHIFLSFSVVSDVIRQWFVVLTVLAASGHFAYGALCFVSVLFPSRSALAWGGGGELTQGFPVYSPRLTGSCGEGLWNVLRERGMKSKDRRHHAFSVNSPHAVDSAASEAVRFAV
jgi:hypothetical protein